MRGYEIQGNGEKIGKKKVNDQNDGKHCNTADPAGRARR